MTLGGEVFHTTGQTVGQGASTGLNVGGFYNIDEHNHLLFSVGKELQNAAQTNRVSSYLGSCTRSERTRPEVATRAACCL